MRGGVTMLVLCSTVACAGKVETSEAMLETCRHLETLWSLVPEECRPTYDHDNCLEERVSQECAEPQGRLTKCLIELSEPFCTEDAWDFLLRDQVCFEELDEAGKCLCQHEGEACD